MTIPNRRRRSYIREWLKAYVEVKGNEELNVLVIEGVSVRPGRTQGLHEVADREGWNIIRLVNCHRVDVYVGQLIVLKIEKRSVWKK